MNSPSSSWILLTFCYLAGRLMNSWPVTGRLLLAATDDPIVADKMNRLPKIVFSKTLSSVEWQNTRLVKENVAEEISKLKQQPGKDLIIFGSSDLAVTL